MGGIDNAISAASSLTIENNMGWTQRFSCDGLNRLVGGSSIPAGSSTPQFWCWGYDSFGNRLTETTSTSGLSASSCPTNSTTTVQASYHPVNTQNQLSGDPAITYDAAGNTTADHDNSYLYDGDGRVCAVNNGLVMKQYIYDADGNRVAKGTITSFSCDTTVNGFQPTTSYALGLGDEQVTEMTIASGQATWAHTNVYAGGALLATYDPLGLHFQLTDWLGSRRVQTNAFGQVEENCVNSPYGNGLICSSPTGAPSTSDDATEHHFTGKERDAETGLDFFGARYYSSPTGRWMSPDWAAKPEAVPYSSLGDPQTLNLYGYVGNNPLSKADADGHCWPICELITPVANYVATHPGVAKAVDKFTNSIGIKSSIGVAYVTLANGPAQPVSASASVVSEARVDGSSSSAVQLTGGLPGGGVSPQGTVTFTFQKNGEFINPVENIKVDPKMTASISTGQGVNLTASASNGRVGVGVGVQDGIVQGSVQLTASSSAAGGVISSVGTAAVHDVRQTIRDAKESLTCSTGGCAHQ
jgi:RHS repeat-associated protein